MNLETFLQSFADQADRPKLQLALFEKRRAELLKVPIDKTWTSVLASASDFYLLNHNIPKIFLLIDQFKVLDYAEHLGEDEHYQKLILNYVRTLLIRKKQKRIDVLIPVLDSMNMEKGEVEELRLNWLSKQPKPASYISALEVILISFSFVAYYFVSEFWALGIGTIIVGVNLFNYYRGKKLNGIESRYGTFQLLILVFFVVAIPSYMIGMAVVHTLAFFLVERDRKKQLASQTEKE